MKPTIDERYKHKNRAAFYWFDVESDPYNGVENWFARMLQAMMNDEVDTITIHRRTHVKDRVHD